MKRIGLLSRKGGVGKTLCSMALAQVLSERYRVAVLDIDPEGSAQAWASSALRQDTPLPYAVYSAVAAAGMDRVDYLVVDTPPNDPKTLASVARESDFVFIPVQPGEGEMDRLEPTLDVLRSGHFKSGAQLGVILNFAERDNLSLAMPAALEQLGYPLVASIKKSVEYRRAFGGLLSPELLEPFRGALEAVGAYER